MGCPYVFLQCGRKFGKTFFVLRKLIEHALLPTNNGMINFHCVYQAQQAKRIIWIPGLIQKICNPMFIKKTYETELRVEFLNGRHLIIDGSDNYKAHEGLEPAALGLDEFKRFNPMFWEYVEPNMSVHNATALFAGAPPDRPCQYTEVAEFVRKVQEETGEGFFVKMPSWMNDKIPGLAAWLVKRRKHYIDRGEEHVFLREYAAEYVPGGIHRIFPNKVFNPEDKTVVRPQSWFLEHVKQKAGRFEWFCIADPSHGGTFALLFAALDPMTRKIYLVDCIYQKDRSLTGCHSIWQQVKEVISKWQPNVGAWTFGYDDHEAWFPIEMMAVSGSPNWMPAGKQTRGKEAGISLIKDAFQLKACFINEETMEPLIQEFILYKTNDEGRPEKKNDDLIDTFRYLLYLANWDPNEVVQEEIPDHIKNDPWLASAYAEGADIENPEMQEDWLHDMFEDYTTHY
jgi:hypothetical protein